MCGSALEGGAVFEGEGQAAIRVGRGVVQQAAPKRQGTVNAKIEEIGPRKAHSKEYSPYDVYLRSMFELFKSREETISEWENHESIVYRTLSQYQKDGYNRHCIRLFRNHGMKRFKLRVRNVYLNWSFFGYARY